jgi:hypothetical protein
MEEEVIIPTDTLMRMALIQENHLKGEYAYMRKIVSSHEKELAWLSLGLVALACMNYYLCVKIYRMEQANGRS